MIAHRIARTPISKVHVPKRAKKHVRTRTVRHHKVIRQHRVRLHSTVRRRKWLSKKGQR